MDTLKISYENYKESDEEFCFNKLMELINEDKYFKEGSLIYLYNGIFIDAILFEIRQENNIEEVFRN